MVRYLILISAALVIAFSCSNQGEEEAIIPFSVIHSGTFCSVSSPKQVYVTSNAEFQNLMNEVYANLDQRPNIPEVDFSKNDVAAVFMGTKNTGGYAVNFDKVIKRNDDVTFAVFETSPGKNCPTTQEISQPYEIVKIPKINKKTKFILKQRTKDCQ